jgi:hypothetical protein
MPQDNPIIQKIESGIKFLEGKKTFILSCLMIIRACVSYSGDHNMGDLLDKTIYALGISTLRMGIKR